jgi:hypothetical protein
MCRWYCQYYLTVSKVLCDVQVVGVGIILHNGKTLEDEIVRLTLDQVA